MSRLRIAGVSRSDELGLCSGVILTAGAMKFRLALLQIAPTAMIRTETWRRVYSTVAMQRPSALTCMIDTLFRGLGFEISRYGRAPGTLECGLCPRSAPRQNRAATLD